MRSFGSGRSLVNGIGVGSLFVELSQRQGLVKRLGGGVRSEEFFQFTKCRYGTLAGIIVVVWFVGHGLTPLCAGAPATIARQRLLCNRACGRLGHVFTALRKYFRNMSTVLTGVNVSPVNMEDRKALGIKSGDTVRVHQKIVDPKGKARIQVFEGTVLARKHGDEPGATFTVRKMSSGVGVEKIYPLYSPNIDKIEIVRRAKVRRSKLYYIREKVAREIKRQMRRMSFVSLASESEAEAAVRAEEEAAKAAEEAAKVAEAEALKAAEAEAAAAPAEAAVETPAAEEAPTDTTPEETAAEADAPAEEETKKE